MLVTTLKTFYEKMGYPEVRVRPAYFPYTEPSMEVEVERDLKALWPEETWIKRHLQIIFFGREYCPARNHDLAARQICGWAASAKRIREEASR